MIPIEDEENIVSFDEGFTPLLETEFNGKTVFLKQDHLFPTGSFKDRGASVLISKVKELGIDDIVEDSSGNAGCAIAAYAAKANIRCDIFVPQKSSTGKLAQIKAYGAHLRQINGDREDAANAALQAAKQEYYASHAWNPFFLHGTKTFAFEVCEQLGWEAPDTVILPVGNGTLLLGAYLGFKELLKADIIKKLPKFIAVQVEACAPLYLAFKKDLKVIPSVESKATPADGIAIAQPIRGKQILEAVRATEGLFLTVKNAEITQALEESCSQGYYIEPTAAATIAGLHKYLSQSPSDQELVTVLTGSGLKTPQKIGDMIQFK